MTLDMIAKRGGKFIVLSKSKTKSGKRKKLGSYSSKAAAKKRLQQVEYFKRVSS